MPTVGGTFWSARNEAGREVRNRPLERGLWLAPGDVVAFDDQEGDELRLRRLDLDLAIAGRQSSTLHLDFRTSGGARARLTVLPKRSVSAQLVTRDAEGAERLVESVEFEERRPRPRMPFRLSVRFDGEQVEAFLDDEPLLAGSIGLPARGSTTLSTDGARLRGIRLEAERLDGESGRASAESLVRSEDLVRAAPSGAGAWLARTLLILLLVGGAGFYLRALCLGAPSAGALFAATLALAAPAAAPVLLRPWWSPPFLPMVCGALALLGLSAALFVLRREITASRVATRASRLRVVVVPLALVAAGGALAWDVRADRVEAAAKHAREDAASLTSEAVVRSDPVRLDAGSALVLGGQVGGFVLEAEVRLGHDALLEVRQGRRDAAIGTALVLSADARWPSGILRLGPRRVERLGEEGPVLPAGVARRLRLESEGGRFAARWGSDVVADVEDLDARAGPITLVTVSGEADVSALALTPQPPGIAGVRPAGWPESRPFLFGIAVLALGGGLLSLLLRRPLGRTLEVCAFALAPPALALLSVDDGAVPTSWSLAASAAAVGLLVGLPLAHGRGLSQLRLVPATLLCVAVGVLATLTILPGAGDGSDESATRAVDFASFPGARLYPGLIHYQHDRSRALNGYLAGHAFRGRRFAVERRGAGERVICVGSSSTYGAGIPESSALDWPSVLEPLLPPGTEVMNGGIRGSNAALLSVFQEEVLARFDPDVVVVTLFHNDSISLPQFDAPSLLERLAADGASPGPLSRFLVRREIEAGVEGNRRFLERHRAGDDPLPGWRAAVGTSAVRTPPERFSAAMLRLLERATAAGARPILVKEPVFADEPMVWRSEFDAVLDRLGREFDAPVVDPAPRLEREGGSDLFMDHVHLNPRGHRVMAEFMAPVVARELARGRRSR